jgi:hypothetical protein
MVLNRSKYSAQSGHSIVTNTPWSPHILFLVIDAGRISQTNLYIRYNFQALQRGGKGVIRIQIQSQTNKFSSITNNASRLQQRKEHPKYDRTSNSLDTAIESREGANKTGREAEKLSLTGRNLPAFVEGERL